MTSSKRSSSASLPTTPRPCSAPPLSVSLGAASSPTPPSSAATARSTGHSPCSASSTARATATLTSASFPTRPSALAGFASATATRSTAATAASSSTTSQPWISSSWFFKKMDLLLWDPVTGEEWHIPIPDVPRTQFSAAVMCAAAGCDHLDCHGGAFRIAFLGTGNPDWVARVFVYSSEAGEWSTPATAEYGDYVEMQPPVLSGDVLYFICQSIAGVLSYDLRGGQGLSLIDRPDEHEFYSAGIALIAAEDGSLTYAGLRHYSLDLWSLEMMGTDGVVRWTLLRVIKLENLIAIADPSNSPYMMCIAKGPNDSEDVIFVAMNDDIYMIGLESQSIRKVCEGEDVVIDYPFFPYMSFFTPDCAAG